MFILIPKVSNEKNNWKENRRRKKWDQNGTVQKLN
jgi:hypothetical protein